MKPNPKISAAVAAILSAPATAIVFAAAETTTATGTGGELQEVVVTAERRAESVQDVPITIQALTSETLTQLNVKTFDDFVKYLPNVTAGGYGPGQSNVFIRGLATSIGGTQGVGATGSFPNVATYLDDQSGQVPGRNLDIYAADLERIEILEGPQGTLFGAGAQAGVVRYITNKPKLDRLEANVSAAYATTAHGDPSTSIEGVLNVPVIPDKFAIRLVAYNDSRGGYIDNIPSTFTRAATDQVVVNYFGGVVPPNSGPIKNNFQIGRAINPLTYKGVRGEFLYQFNDDWNFLVSQSYQNLDAEGVFWQEAYDGLHNVLPELSVQLYNPSYNKDKFTDTAWTLNGKLGFLQAVYTGAYLDRNITQQQDYTNYARGTYAGYYQCDYPGYPFNGFSNPSPGSFTQSNYYPGQGVTPGFCYSPSAFWTDNQKDTHQSHEIRLSTPTDWRFRVLAGGFYEKYLIYEGTDWFYGTSPHFYPIGPPQVYIVPGTSNPPQIAPYPVTVQNPNVRPLGDAFFDDIKRGYTQWAGFLSLDFDIIPKKLTLTGGTRYYSMDTIEKGTNVGSFGCEINGQYDSGGGAVPPNPCVSTLANGVPSNQNNLDAKHLEHTWSGAKSRANLTWHITPEILTYVTWSQGFRPGGFNRAQAHVTGPLANVFVPPVSYAPDNLTNYEVGWKTEWLDRHLQVNGAVYREDWKDTQIEIFDPGFTGNLTFTTNGPDYRVKGLELQFIALPVQGLQISGAAAWNSSEVTRTVTFTDTNGQPIIITPNPFGDIGSPLAQSPPFSGNIRARYSFPVADYQAFVQLGAVHQAHSYASTDRVTQELVAPGGGQQCPRPPGALNPACTTAYDDPAFTIYDAAAGVGKENWETQLFIQNFNDERAVTWANYREFIKAESIAPPRTIGLRMTYRFSGK
jgi:iron complex outermembrane recepter protein